MNELGNHPVTSTLTAEATERLRRGLVREASAPGTDRGIATAGADGRRPSRTVLIGAIAAAVLVMVGLITLDVGRTPRAAEAMFTVTPKGDWIDITPKLNVESFDPDAAVEQLRALGLNAQRGTYREWRDKNGDLNHQAPKTEGLDLSSHGFEFADGTEVMFNIMGPVGAEFPLSADGTMLDWEAAADHFGFKEPSPQHAGLEFRRDAPVTIWVLTAP